VVELPILLEERRFGMAAASLIAYGGILAIVLALTISSLVVPIAINQDWQGLLLAASYKSTFGINIAKMDEWAKSAQDTFSDQFKTTHGYQEWR
jgi:hypothetical protein